MRGRVRSMALVRTLSLVLAFIAAPARGDLLVPTVEPPSNTTSQEPQSSSDHSHHRTRSERHLGILDAAALAGTAVGAAALARNV
mmetsp:Transcript_24094/g.72035  ORF Transcript_24094/g.72035 Transcript_24094/m.72035 type:complete len:85 (+) Transcript_24094:61-315(+)